MSGVRMHVVSRRFGRAGATGGAWPNTRRRLPMTLSVVPAESSAVPTITADQLELIKQTIARDATPEELKLFLYDCARQGVHPLDHLLDRKSTRLNSSHVAISYAV